MLLDTTQRALLQRLANAQVTGRAPSMTGAVARNGRTEWSGAIESTADTQYRIGSLTKTFVAVLIMRLRDEGLLDLDDRVDDHLPGSTVGKATIAQLLSHTAGIASETPPPWWERSPGTVRPTLADVLGDAPMKHPPGRRFHYSNPGFATLGALVTAVRGKPWGEVLAAEILAPLEMANTSMLPRAPHAQGWAVHPFADVLLPENVQDVGEMAPAGQLWSTAEDLCLFAKALAGGAEEVLKSDTATEMRTPHSAPEADSWDASYGLGMQTFRFNGRMLAGHTGSMPGFLCTLWICPEEDVAAILLANATAGVPISTTAAEMVSVVADREPRIPEPWKPLRDYDPELLPLTGPWYWGPSPYVIKLLPERGLELVGMSGKGRNAKFRATGDDTWIGLNGYFHGETLRVVRDRQAGRVSHIDLGSFVFSREPYDTTAPIPGGVDPGGWRGRAGDSE